MSKNAATGKLNLVCLCMAFSSKSWCVGARSIMAEEGWTVRDWSPVKHAGVFSSKCR
jgi:hypothetical protein